MKFSLELTKLRPMCALSNAVTVDVLPATPARWGDVAEVMGVRGDPSSCWCQFFRLCAKDWETASMAGNRRRLRTQVKRAGCPPGLLAYIDGHPVGWCALAPKSCYPRVVLSRSTGANVDGVWAITCFVVRVGWRKKGVGRALVEGAIDWARRSGASLVEAYPVDVSERKGLSSDELFHGALSTFLNLGFVEVERPSRARAVVQLRMP